MPPLSTQDTSRDFAAKFKLDAPVTLIHEKWSWRWFSAGRMAIFGIHILRNFAQDSTSAGNIQELRRSWEVQGEPFCGAKKICLSRTFLDNTSASYWRTLSLCMPMRVEENFALLLYRPCGKWPKSPGKQWYCKPISLAVKHICIDINYSCSML